jgi:hypothetical protein
LNGDSKARYQGRYLTLAECVPRPAAAKPAIAKPARKDHDIGGKSSWKHGFFDRPSPPLWRLIENQ